MANAPIAFRDMSMREQNDLVKAAHDGFSIEIYVPAIDAWQWTRNPMFVKDLCYRVMRDDEGMVTVKLPFDL